MLDLFVAIASCAGAVFWFRSATLRLPTSMIWSAEEGYFTQLRKIQNTNAWAAALTGVASSVQCVIDVVQLVRPLLA